YSHHDSGECRSRNPVAFRISCGLGMNYLASRVRRFHHYTPAFSLLLCHCFFSFCSTPGISSSVKISCLEFAICESNCHSSCAITPFCKAKVSILPDKR